MSFVGREFAAWFVSEVTEGTTPTNPAWLSIAQHQVLTPNLPAGLLDVRKTGSVDFAKLAKGVREPTVRLDYIPSTSAFLESFVSTDSAFSFIVRGPLPTPTLFLVYKGCKIRRTEIRTVVYPGAAPIRITHEIWAKDFTTTEPPIGTGSYETIPSTALTFTDATAAKGGVNITDWHAWNLVVDNGLVRLPTPADGTTRTIKRTVRTVTGELIKDFSDLAEYTDITSDTAFTLAFTVSSLTTFTLTNTKWTDVDPPMTLDDLIAKRLSFQAESMSVA